ncbi:MAG: hypothetical protein Q9166_001464 [cf. Caloplaca sp. 2 TL-2023]
MAVLHGVTVRLVSKSTKDGPREYIKPNASRPATDDSLVERYIEAWPGMDFQVEIYFSRDFNTEIGAGVLVCMKIDGGPTYGYHYSKAQINRFQMSGSPIVFEGIEQSPTTRMAFRFGSMSQNIDWALGDPDSQATDLGTIEVQIGRVKYKRNVLATERSPPSPVSGPRAALDLSGQQINDDQFTNALWSVCSQSTPAESTTDMTSNAEPHYHTSRDFKMLAEKVDRLERQLKESHEQTAALMQTLVGGIHATIKAALDPARTGAMATTPAQNSSMKRKRRTEEVTPVVERRTVDPASRNYYGD